MATGTAYGSTPSQAYSQQVTSALASKNPSVNLLGQLGGEIAPTIGLMNLQGSLTQQQLGLIGQQTALTGQYTSAMAGYTLGKLGISQQQNTLQEQTLAAKQGETSYLNQIEQQQYGLTEQQQRLQQQQYQGTVQQQRLQQQQYGLTTEQQTYQKQSYTQTQYQQGIGQQQFQTSLGQYTQARAQEDLAYQNQLFSQRGAQAVSGAENTTGQHLAMKTIQTQYSLKMGTINRQEQEAYLGNDVTQSKNIQSQLGQASTLLTYQKQALGQQSTNLTYEKQAEAQESTNIGYESQALGQQGTLAQQAYTQQAMANAQQNLQLIAQSNGLSQTEVLTRLNYQLSSGQISGAQSAATAINKLAGTWAGEESAIGNQLALGGFAAGMNLYAPAAGG